ncbi:MAG: shikimate dehydrogenase [Bacteroidota bacterium]|nr:shikimate dehydrogenase [Bacteroidota bacterium]
MKKVYGLIGQTLSHSFSKNYFSKKFQEENIEDCVYELFEIQSIDEFPDLLKKNPSIAGLNVTIPYKEQVLPYVHKLDISASKVGAINVIKVKADGILEGYNSDYYGFKKSLEDWLPKGYGHLKAMVLGTGGSSKAVTAALADLNIDCISVSRKPSSSTIDYATVQEHLEILHEYRLIINTTPVGMYPHTDQTPDIDFSNISRHHLLFDLIYNPIETKFLSIGKNKGAKIKNGLEMLHLQAEKSWEIWNT